MVESFGTVFVDFIFMCIPKSFEFPLLVVRKNVLNRVQQLMCYYLWIVTAEQYENYTLTQKLVMDVMEQENEDKKRCFDSEKGFFDGAKRHNEFAKTLVGKGGQEEFLVGELCL
jgi:hypothetical protein